MLLTPIPAPSHYDLRECRLKVTRYLGMPPTSLLFKCLCRGTPVHIQIEAIRDLFQLLEAKFGPGLNNFGRRREPYGALQSLRDSLKHKGILC